MNRQYILDSYIKFTPSDSSLEYCEGGLNVNGPLLLPVPASRLLQKLLVRSPELISKEELLIIVWENYGMKGSMNNLVHYTMILRKIMNGMNIGRQIIVTVHNIGLMVNPILDVRLISESVTETQNCSI